MQRSLFVLVITMTFTSHIFAPPRPAATSAQTLSPKVEEPKTKPPDFDLDQYVFGMLRRGPNWTPEVTDETRKIQAGHMAHIQKMAAAGKLIAAGPMGDNGELRGLLVFHQTTLAEAQALAAEDPALQAGRLKLEVLQWWGPKGIGAKYAERVKLNPKGAGTTTKYHLVLLWKGANRSAAAMDSLQIAHMWYMRKQMDAGNMPLAGPFENGGDLRGIFVIASDSMEAAKAITEADPAVKAGRLKAEIHPWYSEKEVMPE